MFNSLFSQENGCQNQGEIRSNTSESFYPLILKKIRDLSEWSPCLGFLWNILMTFEGGQTLSKITWTFPFNGKYLRKRER